MRDYDTTRNWSKKDTKRWCRGKVGVEHQPECYRYSDLRPSLPVRSSQERWRILACKVCGKHLAHFYPFMEKQPPAWVDK